MRRLEREHTFLQEFVLRRASALPREFLFQDNGHWCYGAGVSWNVPASFRVPYWASNLLGKRVPV